MGWWERRAESQQAKAIRANERLGEANWQASSEAPRGQDGSCGQRLCGNASGGLLHRGDGDGRSWCDRSDPLRHVALSPLVWATVDGGRERPIPRAVTIVRVCVRRRVRRTAGMTAPSRGSSVYALLMPPSECRIWPLIHPPRSDRRKLTMFAASFGVPIRGCRLRCTRSSPDVVVHPPGVRRPRVDHVGSDTKVSELGGGCEHDAIKRSLACAVGRSTRCDRWSWLRCGRCRPAWSGNWRANARMSNQLERALTANVASCRPLCGRDNRSRQHFRSGTSPAPSLRHRRRGR